MSLCVRRSRHSFSRHDFRIQRMLSQDELLHKASDNASGSSTHFDVPATQKRAQQNQMTRKLVTSKFANWILCFCHIRVLGMENSIKEAISIMKPKQIIISILAVLFVFPFMGTFAQQVPNSVY